MTKCPWCAEEIQDKAIICRHCQREVADTPRPAAQPPPKKSSSSSGCLWSGMLLGLAILALPVILISVIGSALSPSTPTTSPSTGPAATSPAPPAPPAKTPAEQLAEARASIAVFAKATEYANVPQVLATAAEVSSLVKTLNVAAVDPSLKADHATARKALATAQGAQFPKLRRAWVRHVNGALWERNMEAACITKSCDVVQFVGGQLASNARKKELLETFEDNLRQLRVRQVRMKWFKRDDEYTYWTLVVPKDHELVP